MADKYYDMGAVQAFYDKIKTIFQTVVNKVTSWSSTTSDDKYPSEKLVKDSLDAKVDFQYNDSNIGTNSPAADCKTFFSDDTKNPQRRIKLLYNDKGNENTIIFSKANSKKYGNILKYGYNDRYMYLLRYKNNEWQSNDWEKVYAGYADTAGSATTAASVLYADEKYGGAFRNSLSPFDNYAFKNSNCFFGAKPSALSIEYSTDGGTTWVDYGLTDAQKQSLFSQYGTQWVACGKNTHIQPGYTGSISGTKDLSNDNIANQRLRITICTTSLANEGTTTITDNWIYCRLRRIGIYMSTNSGGPGAHCLIQRRTSANFKSATDTWVDVGDYKIQGDSGWNSIPCNNATSDNSITFGTSDAQTRQIRFIIWSDQLSSTPAASQTGNLMIYKIVAYAEQIWSNSSANINIGNNGSPFTVDSSTGSTYFSKGITCGVAIPVGSGGTGQTTANAAANAFINALSTGSSTPQDNDYYVSQYVGGGTTTTSYHRRPVSALWNYIKDKISSVLGLSETNGVKTFSGTATTASNVSSNGAASNSTARHIWFSDSATETKRVHDDNFKYTPSTNTVTTNISGNAATASAAATGSALETAINGKVSSVGYDSVDKKLVETINGASSDIVSVSTLMSDMVGSVANGDTGFPTGDAVYDALVANGKGAVIIDTSATSSDIDDILTDGRLPVLRSNAPGSSGYYQLMSINSGAYVFGRCFEDYIHTWTLAAGTWTVSSVQLAPKTNGSTPGSSLFYREDGTWAAPLPRKVIESTDYCLVGTFSSTNAADRYAGAVFSVLGRDSQDRNKAGFLYIKKGRWTEGGTEANTCFSKFVCMSATVPGTVNFVKFYQVSSSNNEIQVWAQNNQSTPLMITLLDPGNLLFTVGTTSQSTLPTGAEEISQYLPAMSDITSGFATVGSANVPVYVGSNGVITACGVVKQAYHHTIRNVYDNTVSTNVKCDLNDRKYDDEGKYTVCVFNNSSTYSTYHAPEAGWAQVDTEYHPGNSSYATQVARFYTGNIWYRAKNNNSWGTWKKLNS